jgi:exosortase
MILALALLVSLVYWPSTAVLGAQWSDFTNITYTHGWLILVVCVALVIGSRRDIASAPAGPWPLALAALVLCILAWLVCYRASIQDLHITIFPAIFWLAAASSFGWPVGRLLLFPVAFFYFALPSWSQLSNPLQELTVAAMHGLLALTGPQAVIAGNYIHLPNGSFVVEEGCSGLHFMIVGLAVAALHGELRRDPWKTRVVQLAVMAMLALVANWVRVYAIIEAGYLTDMHSYLLRNHYWFGWGVFAGALAIFFWLMARFEPAETGPSRNLSAVPAAHTGRATVAGFLTAVAVLVALPAGSAALRSVHPDAIPPAAAGEPPAPWSAAPPDINSTWLPVFAGADKQQRLAFTNTDGDNVEVFSVSYRTQRQGAELVGSGSTVVGKWLKSRGERVLETAAGEFREIEVVDRSGARSLIWFRYEIAGRNFVIPLASQLWYGIKATVSRPSATLIAVRAGCNVDCDAARRALRTFLASGTVR